ncbi:uncharacterized protein L3040_008238 [Drepanopeziza brunnea f. sp. 'multigermtubi']|uniref:Uncharacterized protein n=1 Tax=Marssonina brunnea f. sp. multigermtubi (strain MB_m1) TaxID=1072389 RepID=K1WNA1_MARBU|nr:uncharacterized protein MBM_07631 [Drepanopeziza brunnea f. sp. 'multigermtubi' MB_m1]EKD14401.1 hypothetical protein MBM_07631 [Drepanopeziza brunnea f. sp. 'multigermtubi' MB_m1]KAJ5034971.1 hypothetical protein L3040_008238 [Drepanopeziza brunnea f. sp. 'multigermtubi']
MASRSLKPASYLAAAGNRSPSPNRSNSRPRPRPRFSRTASTTSTASTNSEDHIFAMLKGLHLDSEVPSRSTTPVQSSPTFPPPSDPNTTPGRKRSQPIAIEMPISRGTAAYTPLSARGDLPGGYFPHHGHDENTRHYRPHPFSNNFAPSFKEDHSTRMPSSFAPSSFAPSSSDTTPIAISMLSGQFSPSIPETLRIPKGKYYPSNYQSPNPSEISTPPSSLPRISLPPTNLSLPPTSSKRASKDRAGHERTSSDVKRKLQQYQRDMIAQAQETASTLRATTSKEPLSPRLLPVGSPGPITPFELEEADGYLVAGNAAVRKENERQIQMMLDEPYGVKGSRM